jgi:hypothetical protein
VKVIYKDRFKKGMVLETYDSHELMQPSSRLEPDLSSVFCRKNISRKNWRSYDVSVMNTASPSMKVSHKWIGLYEKSQLFTVVINRMNCEQVEIHPRFNNGYISNIGCLL